ncbi:ClpA/ClpB-like protein [Kineococcus xinjiangensis]|uniref:ClpA/ClpB-like protein n=1 Tax=Kineococcus xinjiangensis TaxID=512762 RepID=A0A2S6IK79_9ACTN|nr:Clp protease N-terminal domain-containing protein [Kineococcus xinjiangensis]PPK94642.1 ClpA/ClpB-like protein [Kineococcus xinjiangensis]
MSTGSAPESGSGRSLLRQSRYISIVALEEAARLGHPEVDVEHLLLGLLATGGPSAGLLIAAGVGMGELREAVARLQQQDLAALGVDVPTAPAPPPAPPSFLAAQSLPWNDRAMARVRRASRGDDRALLVELLDDDGRRAARLLEHLGVDVEALRLEALRVEPAGRGCRLHVEFQSRRRGPLASLLRPLVSRTATSQLRFDAQAIAQAAGRTP